MLDFLRSEGINPHIISEIERYRSAYQVSDAVKNRIPQPAYHYYGREVWEEAAATLLAGENLLLVGPKATGKNVLAEGLAAAFGRPGWDVSLYINTDAASLIGTDTFENGKVVLRHGPIYRCAEEGGFGILDEINMAKNESLAVLHATLDFRRVIDVPGYERIVLSDATRFIATMNYGYAGTREINEALASRFMVINMPVISDENLQKLLREEFPTLRDEYVQQFSGLFQDIRKKCDSAEISTKALDLRGLLASVRLMYNGLEANQALKLGIVNKCFDDFERQLVEDLISVRLPRELPRTQLFTD
jgi:MoxR-like ATPases